MNFSKVYNSGVLIAIVGIVLFSAKAILVKLLGAIVVIIGVSIVSSKKIKS